MSEDLDAASIEARIMSLDATSISVLCWLPFCRNNKDIIRRSGAWNFTETIVQQSLERIYKTFEIDSLACALSKRQRAIDLYLIFKNAEYPETAFSRRGRTRISEKDTRDLYYDDEKESDGMDAMDNLDSSRVGTLNDVQLKILKALSEGKDKYVISRDLRISVEQVVDDAPRIFDHLHIEGTLEQRRHTACELYRKYVSEYGEPALRNDSEVPLATSAPKPKEASPFNGNGHDIDHLARSISELSPRVKQVAAHLAEGLDIPAIAKAMNISEASVQPYASNVYSKLGLHFSLGTAKRLGLLKLAYARFVSGEYETTASETPAETAAQPAATAAVTEFKGVNIAVVAQKLQKLTPRLKELALCLIRDKDPIKEMQLAATTLNSYKGSLFSQLGLTGRGLTRKERLKVLGYAHEKASAPAATHHLPLSGSTEAKVFEPEPVVPDPQPLPANEEPAPAEAVPVYGQGVPIILSDPETIVDITVVSGRHREGAFDREVSHGRQSGFHPEVLVVYPTANPTVSLAQLILIKRKE